MLVTLSLGLAAFSLAGLYSNHADLSPRYASLLLGMTNTTGAVPGIVGVAFTGECGGAKEGATGGPSVQVRALRLKPLLLSAAGWLLKSTARPHPPSLCFPLRQASSMT